MAHTVVDTNNGEQSNKFSCHQNKRHPRSLTINERVVRRCIRTSQYVSILVGMLHSLQHFVSSLGRVWISAPRPGYDSYNANIQGLTRRSRLHHEVAHSLATTYHESHYCTSTNPAQPATVPFHIASPCVVRLLQHVEQLLVLDSVAVQVRVGSEYENTATAGDDSNQPRTFDQQLITTLQDVVSGSHGKHVSPLLRSSIRSSKASALRCAPR